MAVIGFVIVNYCLIRVEYSAFILEMNDDFYAHNYGSDRRGIPLGMEYTAKRIKLYVNDFNVQRLKKKIRRENKRHFF